MNKLLVIDDDSAIRKSFMLTFENSGFKIETASSGMEGIEMAKASGYNIIFIDLKMPGMNGIETLDSIRRFNKDVIIYIFTAFHKEFLLELQEAAARELKFEIVHKPLYSEQLLELVQNALLKNI